ncbi:hypothetical protein DIZ81_00765 [Legionella taurinensis]|uniref:Uncharacterized protein n=1 Tax=Legionella taurinensis TaxID=70611 RepID=A0A3A5LLP8_9GAMM|nr:hypothetical protein [Legionella taurinensis]MDX1836593.1 hypothetical protein [Legionella taurinensis]PUT42946.1 hypothetical protein DB744_00770 [Legionella taurinensis]PUT45501.1 hypothetical protein DB746_00770 [Legionella taurinensis]PUT46924.1 hypothetical protein DB743_03230 [Legionella taurinensis]PUT49268.1 hypothetical protein DB745_00770 [Legionella taurinensis]
MAVDKDKLRESLNEDKEAIQQRLNSQIAHYTDIDTQHFVSSRLNEDAQAELYRGVPPDSHHPLAPPNDEGLYDPQYFRKKLIAHIAAIEAGKEPSYKGDAHKRAVDPASATISMQDFLGANGVKLYRLALEEELNSREYRNALFYASTDHYPGEKWAERPAIIVSGPSASGKTVATQAAVEQATRFLPKATPQDFSGNDVVAIDGGKAREVSQMRKLVIQAANHKGFSGIKDLHKQSDILEKAKGSMREAVIKSDLGFVIPETFSTWSIPFHKIHDLMKKIDVLPGTKQLFSRVVGEEPSLFQKIVNFMGNRRAWKREGFEEQPTLDLNNQRISESKAYGASGFSFGVSGSEKAEKWFKRHSKDKLSMTITNDLMLVKEHPPGSEHWQKAEPGEPGVELISQRVFDYWQFLQQTTDGNSLSISDKYYASLDFKRFCKEITRPDDLIRVKPDPEHPRRWLAAPIHDQGALLVSRRVYDQWRFLQDNSSQWLLESQEGHLSEGDKKNLLDSQLSLEEYSKKVILKPHIKTSAEIDIKVALDAIVNRHLKLQEGLDAGLKSGKLSPEEIEKLQAKINVLKGIEIVLKDLNSPSKDSLMALRENIDFKIKALKEHGYTHRLYSETERVLKNLQGALDKAISEFDGRPSSTQDFKEALAEIANDTAYTSEVSAKPR